MCSGYPQVSVAKEPIGVKEPLSDTVAYLTKHQIIFFPSNKLRRRYNKQSKTSRFIFSEWLSLAFKCETRTQAECLPNGYQRRGCGRNNKQTQ